MKGHAKNYGVAYYSNEEHGEIIDKFIVDDAAVVLKDAIEFLDGYDIEGQHPRSIVIVANPTDEWIEEGEEIEDED